METEKNPETGQPQTCWVVTDGKAGMESQCLGLAERLAGLFPDMTVTVKRIRLTMPFRLLGPFLTWGVAHAASKKGDPIAPPWPDILIASGRKSVPAALAARQGSGGRCLTVQIQNPQISPRHFGLVVLPEHDGKAGPGILTSKGALHRVTPARLEAEAARFAAGAGPLPRPLIAAIIGGPNAAYRFGRAEAAALGRRLAGLAAQSGGSLLVTPSRRTGPEIEAELKAALAHTPHLFWDGKGENPYFGWLGLADHVVVTCDSVNMVTEAAATGRPVHVAMLPGGSRKFDAFHAMMRHAGIARPLGDRLEAWSYDPLDETGRVAAHIAGLWCARAAA